MEGQDKRILDLAMTAGVILLKSGAEIFRIEDTMVRITKSYGLKECMVFVIEGGIFLTGENEEEQMYAKVEAVPLQGTQLNKVDAVNQLSREIECGLPLKEAEERIKTIETMPGKKPQTLIFASGLGAGSFAYIVGGNLLDAVSAAIAGIILGYFLFLLGKKKREESKFVINISGAFVATASSYLLCKIGIGVDFRSVTIGAIMPMLPGVSFVNAIRDLADSNYISGAVRMLDTLLVTAGIVIGVGIFYVLIAEFTGGASLL